MGLDRRKFIFSLATIMTFPVATGCSAFGKTYPDYRYRLTVEVDTPQGPRTASSVIAVRTMITGPYTIPQPNYVECFYKGEAVALPLPSGQILFALLRSETSEGWAQAVMQSLTPQPKFQQGQTYREYYGGWHDTIISDHNVHILNPKEERQPSGADKGYPLLVILEDRDDIESAKRVDPNNLAATFGPGYKMKRITVQITDDPLTTGIEKYLPWTANPPEQEYIDLRRGLPLSTTDFKRSHYGL